MRKRVKSNDLVYLFIMLCILFSSCRKSSVPIWDHRGVELIPWQGIACMDVSFDSRKIAIGTIAPAGDPNVIVLSPEGEVLHEYVVGQRWIQQVVYSNSDMLHALCIMPGGSSGDNPTSYECGEKVIAIPYELGEEGYPYNFFHYGTASNHSGVQIATAGDCNVIANGSSIIRFDNPEKESYSSQILPRPGEGVITSLATHPSGAVVTGFSTYLNTDNPSANLFMFLPGDDEPRWRRLPVTDVSSSESPKPGRYGKPTLPDGSIGHLSQRDLPVTAPLTVTVGRGDSLLRIATADYQGWQRWIHCNASDKDRNYGTRFLPAFPTVTIYDTGGEVIHRFDPVRFGKACWVDLTFLPGDRQLLASPHQWFSRGLAGEPLLPADPDANLVWLLDIETGDVLHVKFPDAVAGCAVDETGRIAVSCWNGRFYILNKASFTSDKRGDGLLLGGPAIVQSLGQGEWVAAATDGVVHFITAEGSIRKQVNLNTEIARREKSWAENTRAEKIADGLWQLPSGRVPSDAGRQYVIEAPEGLIMIEAHSGLSFEREWKAMEAVGLDPNKVAFILATHEHGDHAPGAYLWRVTTGAQFVCSDESAYTLRYHIPISTGYGMHPPIPTDIIIQGDKELDLAGMKFRAVRLPGHTFGSLGWVFEIADTTYAAIGDLIMPGGKLGYAGSVNFSAADALKSLLKLDSIKPDIILPGHGQVGTPERYVAAGISEGKKTGWGKIKPMQE